MAERYGTDESFVREVVGDFAYGKAYAKMSDSEAAGIMRREFVKPALADAAIQSRIPDESGAEAMRDLAARFERIAAEERIGPEDWRAIEPWIETKLEKASAEIRRTRGLKDKRPFVAANARYAELVSFRDHVRSKLAGGGRVEAA